MREALVYIRPKHSAPPAASATSSPLPGLHACLAGVWQSLARQVRTPPPEAAAAAGPPAGGNPPAPEGHGLQVMQLVPVVQLPQAGQSGAGGGGLGTMTFRAVLPHMQVECINLFPNSDVANFPGFVLVSLAQPNFTEVYLRQRSWPPSLE
ncbi:hypothetical protein PLESTM_000598200 [Pleodorina starrii]|nr:hypothetical protein PLESTM_000598200 [Pleodorina starrii]